MHLFNAININENLTEEKFKQEIQSTKINILEKNNVILSTCHTTFQMY